VKHWEIISDNLSDRAGRNVEASGADPEALIQKCRQAALDIIAERQNPDDSSLS